MKRKGMSADDIHGKLMSLQEENEKLKIEIAVLKSEIAVLK